PFDLPPLEDEMTSPSEDLEFPGEEDAQVDPDEVMEEAAPLLSPPASQAEILPPENLSPSSNPLLFPTQPEEVTVDISQPITLEEAILLARQNNPNFRVAWLNLEKARAGLRQALAARLPNLGTQMSLTQTDSAQSELSNRATGGTLGGGDTTTTAFDATLELTYNLYTGGRRSALIRQAEEQVRFNQLEVERVAHELRLNVTNAYYGVQEANSQVAIEQAAVDNAQQTLRDAELLEQAGLGTRFDVLRAQVDLANSEQALRSASANQQVAQRQLAQVLNIGQRAEVRAADEVERAGEWDLSLEETIVLAYRNRAELEQQLAQREIDEQQRQAALADIRPQVSLFANYNFLGRFDDDFGPADGYALGARLQWTFFDGGAAKASSEQEELDIEIAETNFEQRRNEIRLEVEEAYANLRARDENIQTATVAVQLAEESLRLARLRFQAGVGTQTDVIDAQTEVTRAQNNLLTAIIGYNRALASLQRAVSNLPNNRLFDQP
ncbi:TolC family protein, partial [Spirulina sp. CS-785/01]|uniref:TolC family protein n=1 Tax=Spirulina sp. CS-785/01 TaxID=3021716 RepID=UPI00232F5612